MPLGSGSRNALVCRNIGKIRHHFPFLHRWLREESLDYWDRWQIHS